MKILITGGAGFLGLHLSRYPKTSKNISLKKSELFLLDIANFQKSEYPKSCKFFKTDIRNSLLINDLFKKYKFDYVIHAAAALPLWKPKDIFEINVGGTKNILYASIKNNVKRVIFISSTAVYGVPKKHPIQEDDPLIGVGPYGKSKIEAEKICWEFIEKGLNTTIIRPKTFIGPHRLGVFEILFDWVKDGKKIPVIGSGKNHYQLLDVEDLVEVIYLFLIKSQPGQGLTYKKFNNVFNVGAEKFGKVREDLEKLFEYAYQQHIKNLPTRMRTQKIKLKNLKKSTIIPTPAFVVKKLLWFFEKLKLSPLYQWIYDTADHDSYVSIDRIVKTLSWHPKYSNSDALIRAYQWYLDNYQEIKSQPPGLTHRVGWNQGILEWIKKIA